MNMNYAGMKYASNVFYEEFNYYLQPLTTDYLKKKLYIILTRANLWEENEVPCTTNDDIQQREPGRTILLKDTILCRKYVMCTMLLL